MRDLEVSAQARQGQKKLLEFVADLFNEQVANDLEFTIQQTLAALPLLPEQWPVLTTKKHGRAHKVVVNRNTIILYILEADRVLVLDIFDARSDWQ